MKLRLVGFALLCGVVFAGSVAIGRGISSAMSSTTVIRVTLPVRVAALERKVRAQDRLLACLRYEPVAVFGNAAGREDGYYYLDAHGNTVYTTALNLARGDPNAFNMVIVPARCAGLLK